MYVQVTKGYLYHLLGLWDYYIMYRQFYEISGRVTKWVTDQN